MTENKSLITTEMYLPMLRLSVLWIQVSAKYINLILHIHLTVISIIFVGNNLVKPKPWDSLLFHIYVYRNIMF